METGHVIYLFFIVSKIFCFLFYSLNVIQDEVCKGSVDETYVGYDRLAWEQMPAPYYQAMVNLLNV